MHRTRHSWPRAPGLIGRGHHDAGVLEFAPVGVSQLFMTARKIDSFGSLRGNEIASASAAADADHAVVVRHWRLF